MLSDESRHAASKQHKSQKFARLVLHVHGFTAMAQARAVLAPWRRDYNTTRPHSKLGGCTPAEIAGQRG
jgi:transposase InsO family protein